MKSCDEIAQQSWLLHHWLEAEPFLLYRGWQIRACREGKGWVWDLVEPSEYGFHIFESPRIYANRSRALLEARKMVLHLTVSHELEIVLADFTHQGLLEDRESQALLNSTQSLLVLESNTLQFG